MYDVAIVGAGAAGLAAARRLAAGNARVIVLEAADRIGGRAYTPERADGLVLDLGCGWLHSGDVNPWTQEAERLGFEVVRKRSRWGEQAGGVGFPPDEQRAYRVEADAFYERLESAAREPGDRPAADLLAPGNRWNGLIDATSTYISGTELSRVSVADYENYADTGVNWRVRQGYGTLIAAFGAGLPVRLGTPVASVDHGASPVRLETPSGTVTARAAIVTVSTGVLAAGAIRFSPGLPDKLHAASGVPLGLADKLFLSLDEPDAFEPDSHLIGRTDRTATGSYYLRPFGQPVVEMFVGGENARALEKGGSAAFEAFALDELADLLGNGIRGRMRAIAHSAWERDPLVRGAYSCALPGRAGERAVLAAPVNGRLFFAGEATSTHDFSTAHGAYRSGIRAAEEVLAAHGAAESASP
jgi:monoamine oxidase